MHDVFTEALNALDEISLERYVRILTNNPHLGPLNHANLFLQENIERTVVPESSIEALHRKPTGREALIFLPVMKEELALAKVRVKEVSVKRTNLSMNNYTLRFTEAFGLLPIKKDLPLPDRLGMFDKEEGQAFISTRTSTMPGDTVSILNDAILEILVDIFLSKEDIEDETYRRFVLSTLKRTLKRPKDRKTIDINELKASLDERRLLLLSMIIKWCRYIAQCVTVDAEEIMLLRTFMTEDKDKTLNILEDIENKTEDEILKLQLKELNYKLNAVSEEDYQIIYTLKHKKKLNLHLRFEDYIDAKTYMHMLLS